MADTVLMCAAHVQRFGITPKVALVAHSDFGDFDTPVTLRMRAALKMIHERAPELMARRWNMMVLEQHAPDKAIADTDFARIEARHARRNGRLALRPDIDRARGIVADEYDRKPRHASGRGGEGGHRAGDPLAQRGGERLAVDHMGVAGDLRIHRIRPARR